MAPGELLTPAARCLSAFRAVSFAPEIEAFVHAARGDEESIRNVKGRAAMFGLDDELAESLIDAYAYALRTVNDDPNLVQWTILAAVVMPPLIERHYPGADAVQAVKCIWQSKQLEFYLMQRLHAAPVEPPPSDELLLRMYRFAELSPAFDGETGGIESLQWVEGRLIAWLDDALRDLQRDSL